jgi:CDP-4-dehydro-6-deoxyglucose reductase, E3
VSCRVVIAETGDSFESRAGESVLEAGLRQGIALKHECTFGGCGTCRVKLLEGRVQYDELPLALSPEEAEAGYALLCQAHACTDLVVSTGVHVQAAPARRCSAVVSGASALTADIVHLELELEADEFAYLPGQYMNVLLPDGAHRSFSMASTPRGNAVDFHVRRIPGGRFTDAALRDLTQGDRLDVEIPLGEFRFHAEDYRELLMVATGTGLAPIKSILESLIGDDDCPPVALYWGMRTEADLYLADQIRSWTDRLYEFRFVPVLSRAGDSWSGRRGHVQEAVVQDITDLSGHSIYMCGSPLMIADAKRRFLALGASMDHIYSDGFSFHHQPA